MTGPGSGWPPDPYGPYFAGTQSNFDAIPVIVGTPVAGDGGGPRHSPWAITSVALGACAFALAFIPYYVGVVAAVLGVVGLAAGIVGWVRRGRETPTLASIGVSTSALAVVVGIVMTFVYEQSDSQPEAPPPATEAADTDTVLEEHLEVTFGDPGPGEYDGETVGFMVPVTLSNRMDEPRQYFVDIAAFDGNTQLVTELVQETLNAHETKDISVFGDRLRWKNVDLSRMQAATFKVIEASSYPPEN